MARKSRIVLETGVFHIVARVAHGARLLGSDELKALIARWIYGIARYSGVRVLAYSILDNHIHLEVEVLPVPAPFLLGTVPAASSPAAFSMRPAECNAPRYQPDFADYAAAEAAGSPIVITPAGDSPSQRAIEKAIADCVPVTTLVRPRVGFALPDDELRQRLEGLCDGTKRSAEKIMARWARLAAVGNTDMVEREKESHFRRMHNVSQFAKTLLQRIAEHVNRTTGHEGRLWQDRFFSSVVEDSPKARTYLTAYIDWNGPKASLSPHPRDYRWGSFAAACGEGEFSSLAREGYERALGCPWEEARARLESIFAEKLPESYDPTVSATHCAVTDADGETEMVALTMPQLIKSAAKRLFRGAFFTSTASFVEETFKRLPRRFPGERSERTVKFLAGCVWREPWLKECPFSA